MGSCLLVVLMRDEDVYVMNVGDSRAIVAQSDSKEPISSSVSRGPCDEGLTGEGISEESTVSNVLTKDTVTNEAIQDVQLTALQLSIDHRTSFEQEVTRIRNEHPNDSNYIINNRGLGQAS